MKVPYMAIIGQQEANNETIAIRKHTEGDLGTFTLTDFAEKLASEAKVPVS